MENSKWSNFTNMLKWRSYAYREDVTPLPHDECVVEVAYVDNISRRFDDWEVHVYYSGNDGCWKWSAEKVENVKRREYPYKGYDEIGMTFLECMEECFESLTKDGIL